MNAIKVISKAQVTVPVLNQEALGIGPGATISWQREDDCGFVQRVGAYSSVDIHQALFRENPAQFSQHKSDAALKAGIASYMRSRHA